MKKALVHEIELYPPDSFNTLLEHEVHRSRRNGEPLTLIHLAVETDTSGEHAQYGAEIFAINAFNVHLRETDIPCKKGNEFLALMPATNNKGGLIVCDRLSKLFNAESQIYDKVSFKLFVFIGMATLPGDRSLSGKNLLENASRALQHARENRTTDTVIFSEMISRKE
jgi:GGDEF domain-containing protein